MHRRVFSLSVSLSLVATSAAGAQTFVPDAGRIIVEQTDVDRRPIDVAATPDDFATGDGDLILLEERKLFFLRTNSSLTATSNATLSDGGDGDIYFLQEFSGGVRTTLGAAEKLSVYAETGFNVRAYVDEDRLNSSVAFLRVGAGQRLDRQILGGDLIVGGDASIELIRDEFFNEAINDQLTLAGYAASPRQLELAGQSLSLTPRVLAAVTIGDVSDYNKLEILGGANAGLLLSGENIPEPLRNKSTLLASAALYARYYPSFFDDVPGIDDRFDLGLRLGVGAQYALFEQLVARTNVGFTLQTSTVDQLDYSELAGTVGAWLEYRF